jgi:hypothetical protein
MHAITDALSPSLWVGVHEATAPSSSTTTANVTVPQMFGSAASPTLKQWRNAGRSDTIVAASPGDKEGPADAGLSPLAARDAPLVPMRADDSVAAGG